MRGDAIYLDQHSNHYAPNSGNDSDTRVSPKLALIFVPWDQTEFFLNAGYGFHSNDARGVINRFDPDTGMPVDRAPALAGSFGKEVGVRTEIVPGLQSSLVLWSLDSDSELLYTADSAGTEINGASARHGVEWNNHWILNQWLLVDADVAGTHARYKAQDANGDLGNHIPNAVGKVGSFGVTLHHVGPRTANAKLECIGGYPLSQDNTLRAPSAIVTNLRLQCRFSPDVTLALDVLNVFNRKYYDIAYEQDYRITPASPLVSDGITVHPGEPRGYRLTLKWQL